MHHLLTLLLPSLTWAAPFNLPLTNRITWEGNVGVPGGIPARATIFTNLPSGTSQATIQAWLDACPSNQVVLLDSGTYTISSGLNLPTGVTLRGSGPTNTILSCGGSYGVNFQNRFSYYDTTAISSGLFQNSTSIVVASAADMDVGDFIRMYQSADLTNLVNPFGLEGGPGTNCLGQWVQIVSKAGTTLGITPPIFWTYNTSLSIGTRSARSLSYLTAFCMWAGIEDLCLSNTYTGSSLQANINGFLTAFCWVKNVQSLNAYGRHIEMQDWFRSEVRESGFYGTLGSLTSSGGYGINIGEPNSPNVPELSTGVLIENNAFESNRTAIVIGYGTSGIVIGYNFMTNVANEVATYQRTAISVHSAHPMFVLFEGNLAPKFVSDFFHGSGSHHVLMRNYLRGRDTTTQTGAPESIELDTWHRYYSVVGNILGYSGITNELTSVYEELAPSSAHNSYYRAYMLGYDSEGGATTQWDTNVVRTLLRQGNFDYVTGTQQWDEANHDLPASFYYSSRPSWYPSGYTWPPIEPSGPTVNVTPAIHWYTYNNRVWDGGAALDGAPPPPISASGSVRASGVVNLRVVQ